jgi:hypothetical protein
MIARLARLRGLWQGRSSGTEILSDLLSVRGDLSPNCR